MLGRKAGSLKHRGAAARVLRPRLQRRHELAQAGEARPRQPRHGLVQTTDDALGFLFADALDLEVDRILAQLGSDFIDRITDEGAAAGEHLEGDDGQGELIAERGGLGARLFWIDLLGGEVAEGAE